MANVSMKSALSAKGMFDIRKDGTIFLEVDDVADPMPLTALTRMFDGKYVKISISYDEELGAPDEDNE